MPIQDRLTIYTFHNNTAYNASSTALKGEDFNTQSYDHAIIWVVPTGNYDGTINFEVSPDGGDTWLAIDARELDDITANLSTWTIDGTNTVSGVSIKLPHIFQIRARLSDGTAGNVTVKGRFVDGRF